MIEALILVVVAAAAAALTIDAALHWQGERYLCDDCRFNDPELCLKPERPTAVSCTAYRRIVPAEAE
ncbi:MAG TPA: hypothetical protein V6D08_00890 [Candidatus Obscuribacterales bacterium]